MAKYFIYLEKIQLLWWNPMKYFYSNRVKAYEKKQQQQQHHEEYEIRQANKLTMRIKEAEVHKEEQIAKATIMSKFNARYTKCMRIIQNLLTDSNLNEFQMHVRIVSWISFEDAFSFGYDRFVLFLLSHSLLTIWFVGCTILSKK